MKNEQALYYRIGGEDAVAKLIDTFYDRVIKDPEIGGFFKNTDVAKIKRMQKEFFAAALGGPVEYTGLELTVAHGDRKIGRSQFSRYVHLLLDTLTSLGIEEKDIIEVIDRVNLYVDDVVGAVGVDG